MSITTIFRNKRLVAAASVPVAVIASGALVWQSSYSAFSATTVNPTNNWTSGTVRLADNDNDTALFNATNLKPGATGAKCIVVSSTGTLASTVKLYGTSYSTTNGLADVTNLTVEEGSGATDANCTGFTGGTAIYTGTLKDFGLNKTGFSSGVGTWAPTGTGTPETKSYRVTYTLQSTAPNTAQGGTAALGFTWEAQNS
ncbi:hypothetical protein GCM10027596_05370 [Nocardioides korecus]